MTDTTQQLPDRLVTTTVMRDGAFPGAPDEIASKTEVATFGNRTVTTYRQTDVHGFITKTVTETVEENPSWEVRAKADNEAYLAKFKAEREAREAILAVAPAAIERIVNKPTHDIKLNRFMIALAVTFILAIVYRMVQS